MEMPVMGRIAAGVPIEAIQEVCHHVAVPGLDAVAARASTTRLKSRAIR